MNDQTAFSDDVNLDPDSTKPVVTITTKPVKIDNIPLTPTGPTCNRREAPWPTIIISVVGAVFVIYSAVAPNISSDRRIFGSIMLALWTIVWALILWVLWRECHRAAAWWLILVPLAVMILFFVLIIILNIGAL